VRPARPRDGLADRRSEPRSAVGESQRTLPPGGEPPDDRASSNEIVPQPAERLGSPLRLCGMPAYGLAPLAGVPVRSGRAKRASSSRWRRRRPGCANRVPARVRQTGVRPAPPARKTEPRRRHAEPFGALVRRAGRCRRLGHTNLVRGVRPGTARTERRAAATAIACPRLAIRGRAGCPAATRSREPRARRTAGHVRANRCAAGAAGTGRRNAATTPPRLRVSGHAGCAQYAGCAGDAGETRHAAELAQPAVARLRRRALRRARRAAGRVRQTGVLPATAA